MLFEDRKDAGQKLADELGKYRGKNTLVLALPRGGVPVGYEISRALGAPLDVLVVRKLGAPGNPEFGIGAIAPEGVRVLDADTIKRLGISGEELEKIESEEREELGRRVKEYRGTEKFPDLEGKTVILVDDGLATGVTARAAIKYILGKRAEKLVVAMPVCALDSVEAIHSIVREGDEVVCISTPFDFSALGLWYRNFEQVSDKQVVGLLRGTRKLMYT